MKASKRLPSEIIALLGTMPDRKLAQETGRAESTIRTARKSRGIQRSKSGKELLPDKILRQLGHMPDAALARATGRSESTIRSARVRRGISRFSKGNSDAKKMLAKLPYDSLCLLSCAPDALVSERLSISLSAVKALRSEFGMTELKVTKPLPPEFFSSLGTQPDLPIAEKYSLSVSTIRRIRSNLGIGKFLKLESKLTDDIVALLGKVSDNDLAKTSGLARTSIRKARVSRNIPAFTGLHPIEIGHDTPKACSNTPIPTTKLDEVTMRLMAWCSDIQLASHLGISKWQAKEIRHQHGMIKLCLRKTPPPTLFQDLGKKPDTTLAASHGLSIISIRSIRENLGIASYKKTNALLNENVITRLGSLPDNELAQQTGLTDKIIRTERVKRGIPPYSKYTESLPALISELPMSKKKLIELLQWAGDTFAAEKLGISAFKLKQVRAHLEIKSLNLKTKPTKSLLAMIGKQPDADVARRFKRSVHYVRSIRLKMSIKAFSAHES